MSFGQKRFPRRQMWGAPKGVLDSASWLNLGSDARNKTQARHRVQHSVERTPHQEVAQKRGRYLCKGNYPSEADEFQADGWNRHASLQSGRQPPSVGMRHGERCYHDATCRLHIPHQQLCLERGVKPPPHHLNCVYGPRAVAWLSLERLCSAAQHESTLSSTCCDRNETPRTDCRRTCLD